LGDAAAAHPAKELGSRALGTGGSTRCVTPFVAAALGGAACASADAVPMLSASEQNEEARMGTQRIGNLRSSGYTLPPH